MNFSVSSLLLSSSSSLHTHTHTLCSCAEDAWNRIWNSLMHTFYFFLMDFSNPFVCLTECNASLGAWRLWASESATWWIIFAKRHILSEEFNKHLMWSLCKERERDEKWNIFHNPLTWLKMGTTYRVISIFWNSILVHSRSGAGCLGAQTFTDILNIDLYTMLVCLHVFEIFCNFFFNF